MVTTTGGVGLYDYGARYYDAAVGRWASVDPMAEITPADSPYSYVLGNPISLIDPTGMVTDVPSQSNSTLPDWMDKSHLCSGCIGTVTNEYVKDKKTGKIVQVGNKGGDETDYVYQGSISEDGKTVTWSENNAEVISVSKLHSEFYARGVGILFDGSINPVAQTLDGGDDIV